MPETLLNSTEVPKTVLGLEQKYQEENKKIEDKTIRAENISESLIDSLPNPSGWRLLVLPFTPKDKTKRWNYYITRIIRQIKNSYKLWLCFKNWTISL
jgi:hypothetical protein